MQRLKRNWKAKTALKRIAVVSGLLLFFVFCFISVIQIPTLKYADADSSNFANWNNGVFPSSGWNTATKMPANCYNLASPNAGFGAPVFSPHAQAPGSAFSLDFGVLTAGLSGASTVGDNINQSFILTSIYTITMLFYLNATTYAGGNSNQFFQIADSCGSTGNEWSLQMVYSASSFGINHEWNLFLQQASGITVLGQLTHNNTAFNVTITSQGATAVSFGEWGTTGAATLANTIHMNLQAVCVNSGSCTSGSCSNCQFTKTYSISWTNSTCVNPTGCTQTTTSTTVSYDATSTVITIIQCDGSPNCATYTQFANKTVTFTNSSVIFKTSTVTQTLTHTALNAPTTNDVFFWLIPMLFLLIPAFTFLGTAYEAMNNAAGGVLLIMFLLGLNIGAVGGIFVKIMPYPILIFTFIPLCIVVYAMRGSL